MVCKRESKNVLCICVFSFMCVPQIAVLFGVYMFVLGVYMVDVCGM